MGKFERKFKDNGENFLPIALTRVQQVIARRLIRSAHRYGHDFKRYLGPTRDIFRKGEPTTSTTSIREALKPSPPGVQPEDLSGMNLAVLEEWRDRFHSEVAFDVIENERLASTYFKKDDLKKLNNPPQKVGEVLGGERPDPVASNANIRPFLVGRQEDLAQRAANFWLNYFHNKAGDLKQAEFEVSIPPSRPQRGETVDGADMSKLRQLRASVARSVHPEGRHIFFALVDDDARKLRLPKPDQEAPVTNVHPPTIIIRDKKSVVRYIADRIEHSIGRMIRFMNLDQIPAGKGDSINLASLISGNNEYNVALMFAKTHGIPIGIPGIDANTQPEDGLIYETPFDIVRDINTTWYGLRGYGELDRIHYFNRLFAHFMGILLDTTPLQNNPRLITITSGQKGRRTIIPPLDQHTPFKIEWTLDSSPQGYDVARRSLVYASNLPAQFL